MPVTLTIPTALRQYAAGNASLALDAGTVDELLARLVELHPALGKQILGDDGMLRSFVNVYVGDEDIRYLQGMATSLNDGETVRIIPAIAGGGPR